METLEKKVFCKAVPLEKTKTQGTKREKSRKASISSTWDDEDCVRAKAKIARESEKIIKQNVITEATIWQIQNKIIAIRYENETLKMDLSSQQQHIEDLKSSYETISNTKNASRSRLENAQQVLKEITEKTHFFSCALLEINEDKKVNRELAEKREAQIEAIKNKVSDMKMEHNRLLNSLREKLQNNKTFINEQMEKIALLENQMTLMDEIHRETKAETATMQASNLVLDNEITMLNKDMSSCKGKYAALKEEKNSLKNRNSLLLTELENKCRTMKNEIKSLNNELSKLKDVNSHLQDTLKVLTETNQIREDEIREEEVALMDKLVPCRNEVNIFKQKRDFLLEEVKSKALEMEHKEEIHSNLMASLQLKLDEKQLQEEELRKCNDNLLLQIEESKGKLVSFEKKIEALGEENKNHKIDVEKKGIFIENMELLIKESDRIWESKENELNNKVKSLQDEIIIKSQEFIATEKRNKEAIECNKVKLKEFEEINTALTKEYNILKRELTLERSKASSVSSSCCGAGDSVLPSSSVRSQQVRKKLPNKKQPTRREMNFDSDGSNCLALDTLLKKDIDAFSKLKREDFYKKIPKM